MKLLGSFLRLAVILSLTSCSRFHNVDDKQSKLIEIKPPNFNGSYFEVITNQTSKTLQDFFDLAPRKTCSKLDIGDTLTYEVRLLANDTLELITFINKKLCQEDTLIGTIEQQYLYLQQHKSWDHSEGYVLFSTETQQSRIGLKSNGDLLIDNWNRWILKLIYVPIIIEKEHFQHTVYKKA